MDENLPKRLKQDFLEHDIFTVRDMGWNSKKNGELLKLMLNEGFEVLLTFDRNLQYQQNFAKYPIAVLVLNSEDNTYAATVGSYNSQAFEVRIEIRSDRNQSLRDRAHH